MSGSPEVDAGMDRSKIDALIATWVDAIQVGNVNPIIDSSTEDFEGIDRAGRHIIGKDGLKAYFLGAFRSFDAEPKVLSSQTSVRGKWAIEIMDLESVRTPVGAMHAIRAHVLLLVALRQQADGSWKLARLVELPD